MYNKQEPDPDLSRRPLEYNLYPIRFYDGSSAVHEVPIDKRVEELDIYNSQFGIFVSDEHDCFFITSGQRVFTAVI